MFIAFNTQAIGIILFKNKKDIMNQFISTYRNSIPFLLLNYNAQKLIVDTIYICAWICKKYDPNPYILFVTGKCKMRCCVCLFTLNFNREVCWTNRISKWSPRGVFGILHSKQRNNHQMCTSNFNQTISHSSGFIFLLTVKFFYCFRMLNYF